ncbi:flagellar basal body P-ring formation chaperone FlgA [Asticcacaulis sp. AND118]|uniref:flagellar basal body P-ring formation chaperone FlgA n=1 Tax=Asticcacaulis sp. AND118 TaxID=2840468 RepID=UPI001D001A2D|nr:flagellar basal body P-ring formation chaperone FlgA [Asticcacaulis sp. AND118]UDF02754.1 flagellar basal body P-ring formation chaperone FlgA [Asticcacaulis sp. AND118]
MHRSVYMLMLAGAAALSLTAPPAQAQETLVLKARVTDGDGRITLGDLFDNAGPAADVVVGARMGTSAVLDAGQVQARVRQAGQSWPNPQGLRRIIVTAGADGETAVVAKAQAGRTKQVLVFTRALGAGEIVAPADLAYQSVQAHLAGGALVAEAETAIGKTVRSPVREGGVVRPTDLTSPVVVRRAEMVKVTWDMNGVSLSMTGAAQKDGAVGDVIMVQNPQSKKLIEAVVTGPGSAATGETAQRLRSQALYSSR